MEVTHDRILSKLSDFKVCKICGRINWYENKECVECGSKEFIENNKLVLKELIAQYEFYEKEGYKEEEIDNITIEV